MVFNSLEFILFFIIVVAVYFALPHRFRWILLLLASYYFYMSWKAEYGFLLLATTFLDYCLSHGIEKATKPYIRKLLLTFSLVSNLGMLFLFKYWTFFSESTRAAFEGVGLSVHIPYMELLLPVGISFYVFQSLSYTIDVYRGAQKAERHFGIFALYVSFFPQLVAGPIERSTHLLPQFRQQHTFDYRDVADGIKLIAWGLFKKIVVADRLAEFVNLIYTQPGQHGGLTLLIATYFFAFQIYCDFSGYSDMARGTARIMGFDFMLNFNSPYFAQNITDFWRRWHISLSSWLRDYLYIPLGGNRKGKIRQYLNIFIIFVVSGIWHGANWTFIIWGAIHGIYSMIGRATHAIRNTFYTTMRIPEWLLSGGRVVLTFHLVCFAWIFFRAQSIQDAFVVIQRIGTQLQIQEFFSLMVSSQILLSVLWIVLLMGAEFLNQKYKAAELFAQKPLAMRWVGYTTLIIIILLFGKFGGSDFIYFQF